MKKLLSFLIVMTIIFFVNACSTIETKVRLLNLTYELNLDQENPASMYNFTRLSMKKINASESIIFEGDILTFTVELEDPEIEFLSLLSVTFNDEIIRANTDDSIATTRNCGSNICIDFPFVAKKSILEYRVDSIKFAKLDGQTGINVIIDENSNNYVNISVYQGDIYPNVIISVNNLNQMIDRLTFYQEPGVFTTDSWNNLLGGWDRTMIIEYLNSEKFNAGSVPNDPDIVDFFQSNIGGVEQGIFINTGGSDRNGEMIYSPSLYITYFDRIYANIYFFNIGNMIYVHILQDDYLLIEMDKRTLIRPVTTSDIISPLNY
jgi:hypothetical protein